ncbi:serine hydrolase [Pleionea sp. CnH1-48]|uniref:serine hydrolase domain-containing protein n=1 Tax=Pleionea sp. CnH1-48 TaxID=2954494 RepID=UPI0020968B2C|nr:serine hydrolase domain-containing protein [Pleionea sp. CnH1-48]MCO7224913.1 serine hydrolase [Pleionea sp. CnH1-48]
MIIKSTFKSLVTITILSGVTSLVPGMAEGSSKSTPEASVADAQISFWDLPYLKEAYIDTTPTDRKDGLAVGSLTTSGANKTMILQLAREMADKKYGEYDSLLIAHQGQLIFESYYLRGRINLFHQQASATKSYTSLVLGRAIELGYLSMADLHKPLTSFLKDLEPTKWVKGTEQLTLHQALTMRGGLSISNDKWHELKGNPASLKGQGLVQTLLAHSAPITSESQRFVYGNFNPDLVMQVIEAVVPGTAKDFIEKELLNKIGITAYRWQTHLDGLPVGGGPSYMTSRDMIKLGKLIINQGKWNGKQLISAKFLSLATSSITKASEDWHPDNFNYGYFFYQTDIKVGDKSYDANVAWGGGGQHLITIEELDLIVVITGHDWEDKIFTQVAKSILPAFVQ